MSPARPDPRRERKQSNAVLVYALLLVSLQVFLLVVALEGLLGDDDRLAWSAAGLSAGLFLVSFGFGRLARDG